MPDHSGGPDSMSLPRSSVVPGGGFLSLASQYLIRDCRFCFVFRFRLFVDQRRPDDMFARRNIEDAHSR